MDTGSQNVRIYHAAMSGNGRKIVFSGQVTGDGPLALYTVNADGSDLTSIPLPADLTGIADVTIDYDGSRVFFRDNWYHLIYKVEGGVVTRILDTNDYPEINKCWEGIETTADGEYVYFREDRDDLWRIRHNGGAPEKVIEDTEVPREDSQGRKGWAVGKFAISADASTIIFELVGYEDPTNYYGVSIKPELFVLDTSGYRQLTNDKDGVNKEYFDISGDGKTIVFSAGIPQNKWYSIHSDGSDKIALEDMGINVGGVSLTYDGTKMFYYDGLANGGRLVNTGGSGCIDLFPRWNVVTIVISATWDTCISDDGSRVSFRFGYSSWPFKEAVYVGYLNEPEAVPDAPIIHNIAFDPPAMPRGDPDAGIILTSRISDPQGLADIERTSTDPLLDGRLEYGPDCPAYFPLAAHDDGRNPDRTAGDGIFSTEGQPGGKIDELDRMTVRMGAMDASKTVVVADAILPIGAIPAPTPARTPTPPTTPPEFSGLIFESRSKSSGSTVQIPLTLKGATEKIGNMDITLGYDPSVLEATEVIKGGLTTNSLFEYNLIDWGTIKISLADKVGFSGDGSIAYVKFNVIGYEGSVSPLKIVSLSANRAKDQASMNIPTQDGFFTVISVEQSRGDCNGDGKITAVDALCALQMAVGKRAEDLVMDVNGDGKVSSIDARKILRIAAGLEAL